MGSRDHRVGNEDLDQVATEGEPVFATRIIALALDRSNTKVLSVTTSSRAIDAAVAGHRRRQCRQDRLDRLGTGSAGRAHGTDQRCSLRGDHGRPGATPLERGRHPHHPAERGFTDDGEGIALSFPVADNA
jgi:hypothetical protein